jgi:hypothetical protein
MGIDRIRLQNGASEEMAKAQEAAASDPALDAIRQQLFGQDYVQDIGRGKGIAQYYTGFGLPQSLQFTQPVVETPVVTTPDVGSPTDGGGGGSGIIETGSGEQATIISPTTQPIDPSGMLPQISPTIQPIDPQDMLPQINEDLIDLGNPTGDSRVVSEEQGLVGTPSYVDPIMDPNLMAIRQQQNIEGLTTPQSNIINDIFNLPEATVDTVMSAFSAIPQALTDLKNKTVNIFGQTFNVPQVLASLAVPGFGLATNVLGAIGSALPSDPRANALREFYDVNTAGTIQSGIMKGYNPISGGFLNTITGGAVGKETNYGLQDAIQDRINTIEESLSKFSKYDPTSPDYDPVKTGQQLDKLADLKDLKGREKDVIDAATTGAPQENIGATDSIYSGPDTITGPDIDEEKGRPDDDVDTPSFEGFDSGGFDPAPAPAPTTPSAPPSRGFGNPNRNGGNGGGGGGGSPGSEGPGGSDAMGSFKKGGIVDLL